MNKTVFLYGNTGVSSLISLGTWFLTHLRLQPTWNKMEENFVFQLQVKVYSHWYYFLWLTNQLCSCCFARLRFGLVVLCEAIVTSVKSWLPMPVRHVCATTSKIYVKDFKIKGESLEKARFCDSYSAFCWIANFLTELRH